MGILGVQDKCLMAFLTEFFFHGTQCAHYEMHGHGDLVLRLFHQMQQEGIKPNHITFAAVLSACSHAEHAALSSRAGNILIYD